MKIGRENCEKYLRFTSRKMLDEKVRNAEDLLAMPTLRNMLMQAIAIWASHIACQQHTVAEIGREIGMDNSQMTSDFVGHVFRRGSRADKPYPTLNKILTTIRKDGPNAIVPYLMKAARYRALDLNRRFEVRRDRSGELRGFNQDDEYGAIDPGEARDDVSPDMEDVYIRREAMADLLAHMGEDFVSDVVILADAVGLKRAEVAMLMFAGRQVELVTQVTQRLNTWLHHDFSDALRPLAEEARRYVLPAKFKADYDKLLAYLYRQSNGCARDRLAKRCQVSGL